MSRLAILILTRNEEVHIEACMESASFADEIVVVDSGSTDRTQAIAESMGARFVTHPMGDDGFAGQRNFALTQTTADWVFYLDADERIEAAAAEEIRRIVSEDLPAAYRVERKNIVFGQLMRHGGHRPDFVYRLRPSAGEARSMKASRPTCRARPCTMSCATTRIRHGGGILRSSTSIRASRRSPCTSGISA